jgi:DNA repair protein RadA
MADPLEDIPGVGPSTAKKLRDGGYVDMVSIAVAPLAELMERTGLGLETASKVIREAREMAKIDIISAKELYERRKGVLRCTTGSRGLDSLLGGGVETQALTELIGEYGAGKTQICFTLCVTCQLPPERGGLGCGAVYIDTEGTFHPQRVYQIAERWGLDPGVVLENITVGRAYTSDHQMLLVESLSSEVDMSRVRLLIVDSVIGHFRGEFVGRENLAERQQRLNKHLHTIQRMAEAYNLAVVLTNQAVADPGQFFGNPNKPAGGHVMGHACTHRIWIQKGRQGTRIAKIIDSPSLPEGEARFTITERGIEDTEG